jgi:hypothetical protein
MKKIVIAVMFWVASFSVVYANPTFYFDNTSYTIVNYTHSVDLFIKTDGSPITAAQTIITLPSTILTYKPPVLFSDYPWPEYDTGTKPNCTHSLLPPDWNLPYKSSPYVDVVSKKLYIACGFTGGYTTQGSVGDKIATITFTADTVGTATFSFDTANTKFYYIGNYISSGAMSNYSVIVQPIVEPTPAPGVIPDTATDSITASDLNFIEVGGLSGLTSRAASSPTSLVVTDVDDTIPSPPNDLPPRSIPDPIQANKNQGGGGVVSYIGDVLSAQSLRELLIPGKSSADKTVVLFNLISVLLFLLILAILIWKFISIKRISKIRARHMSELLLGELAVIETKIEGSSDSSKESIKSDIDETIKKISEEAKKLP